MSAGEDEEDPSNFDDEKVPGDRIRRYAVAGQTEKLSKALSTPEGMQLLNSTDDRGESDNAPLPSLPPQLSAVDDR